MVEAGEVEAETVQAAESQLARFDQSRIRRYWRWALNITVLGVFLTLVAAAILYEASLRSYLGLVTNTGNLSSALLASDTSAPTVGTKLSHSDRLLLSGDSTQTFPSLKWKALWDSAPDRPEFFIEYALAYIGEHQNLPPDFLQTGERLDPGNGWFPSIAAGVLAEQATDSIPRTDAAKKAKVPVKYRLVDAEKLHQAMVYLEKAAAMPRFDSHRRSILEARVRLLPRRSDTIDQIPALVHMVSAANASLPLRPLPGILHVEAERIANAGDNAAFEKLLHTWKAFGEKFAASEDLTMVDSLLKLGVLRGGYRALAEAAEKLHSEEAPKLRRIGEQLDFYRPDLMDPRRDRIRDRAGLFAGFLLPSVATAFPNAPEIRDEDLKPGRMADHEFLSKILAGSLAISMLTLAGLVALYRFRGGVLRRGLSKRLIEVLNPVDWIWILGVGTLAPFLALELVSRLPLLGTREWSPYVSSCYPTAGLFFVSTWLMILLPVLIARWRLEKRAGFIDFRWKRTRIGWGIAVALIVALPLAGLSLLPDFRSMPMISTPRSLIVFGVQIWALIAAGRVLFSRPQHLLKRLTLSRAILPAYLLGALLAILGALASHRLEKLWMSRETLTEITPERPSLSRYEYETCQRLRDEIREILAAP